MKEPVSLDLFPDDVLPSVVDRQQLVFARHRLLFWFYGAERASGLGFIRENACEQLLDALACLGGLGGVW